MASRAILSAAALAAALSAAGQTPDPVSGAPFDVSARTPHQISAAIDTEPARDILTLITGGEGAAAALRRLRASATARLALRAGETNAEDFFGRLVTAATGTPDPLLASYAAEATLFKALLETADKDGPSTVPLFAARVASLLPEEPPVTARLVVLPFIGAGGYHEITPARDGGTLCFVVDLPRLLRAAGGRLNPREVLLRMLRESGAIAWQTLFATTFRKPPAWPPEGGSDLDALLAATVSEGPPALFLIPDEFFPFDPFFAEPVSRAFQAWNRAAETLLKPGTKEVERRDLLKKAVEGDFWARYPAIVGAQFADLLLRKKGRAAYLAALAAGPRAVSRLYAETVKGTKHPDVSKTVRKALEEKKP